MISNTAKGFAYFVLASIGLLIFTLMTAPGAHAQGGIRADNLEYNTPRTHYYSLGDGDFDSANSSRGYTTHTGVGGTYITTNPGVTGHLVAGVHLPDGAVMTELRAYVYDNHFIGANAGNLNISIWRSKHDAGQGKIAEVESIGFIDAIRDFADTTIAAPVIDNQNYSYRVVVFGDHWPGDSTLRVKGVVVTYTIAEAD